MNQTLLFSPQQVEALPIAPGATLLKHFAGAEVTHLLAALEVIIRAAPLRHMETPGGFRMSVAMANCGSAGWVSDRSGYRYDPCDPTTGRPWPAMPAVFRDLAARAAVAAGFANFEPDACLINRYEEGARLTLHQDRNERDFSAPIVSVSLGLPAIFLFGGLKRSVRARRIRLQSGDVVVWGGPGAAHLSQRCAARGGRRSADRSLPLQSHLSQSALGKNVISAHVGIAPEGFSRGQKSKRLTFSWVPACAGTTLS